jgi:transglutaminase-like putative cysteine protease
LRRRLDPPRLRSLAVFSGFALMFILLLAAPLFLAMPRVSKGMSRNGLLPTEMLSGFSESVRLGEVAQIKLNPQVVMRVRVRFSPGEKRRSLRWRGVTLDYYDGQSWNYTGPKPVAMKKIGDSFHLNDTVWAQSYTEQRFFVEPLNISTVFAAPNPFLVAGLPELGRDRGDGLWTSPHEFHTLDYTVFSTVPDPSDENLAADNSRIYPSEILRRHATSYAGFDRRITDLAAELTRDSRTQIEIVRRIENHLRNAYSYSLDLRRVEDGDPVADFLFNTREGHCEYFASAMVLMLRSRRVPARLVNGFQMGEYNKAADVYTVRQSDAHSWVEVFFPKHGWLAFDPTPSAGLSVYEEGLMAWLRQHSEALEMFWLEHVVGFDTGKQISMAITAQAWVSRLFSSYRLSDYSYGWLDWVSNLARSVELWRERGGIDGGVFDGAWPAKSPSDFVSHPLAQILFGLLLVSAAIVSWRRYDRSWRRRMGRNASAAAIAFYAEMIRTLERKGLKRAEDETPGEFSSRLRSPAVAEITGFYQRVRFGNQPLDGGEIARIGILLRELKKQTAKSLLARYRS